MDAPKFTTIAGYNVSEVATTEYYIQIAAPVGKFNKSTKTSQPDKIYYCTQAVFESIKADAITYNALNKKPVVALKEPRFLLQVMKTIEAKKRKQEADKIKAPFHALVKPFIQKVCAFEDEICLTDISEKIFNECLPKNIQHYSDCLPLQISSKCTGDNPNFGLVFKICKEKNSVKFLPLMGTEGESSFVAYTDHFGYKLFIRSAKPEAFGSIKKVHTAAFILLNGRIEEETNPSQPRKICISASQALPLVETTLLQGWSCGQVISAPEMLTKVNWSPLGLITTAYEYLAIKADGDLRTMWKIQPPLTQVQVLKMFLDVSRGLKYLHEKGCVHFDIKEDNILFYDQGSKIHAKIADLGSCRNIFVEGIATTYPGATSYNSPEVHALRANGKTEMGFPHDMWALGVTVFRLFSVGGEKPRMQIKLGPKFEGRPVALLEDKTIREKHQIKLLRQFKAWPFRPACFNMQQLTMGLLELDPYARLTAKQLEEQIVKITDSNAKKTLFLLGQSDGNSYINRLSKDIISFILTRWWT